MTKTQIKYEKYISRVKILQEKMERLETISGFVFTSIRENLMEFREADINITGSCVICTVHCRFNFRKNTKFIETMHELEKGFNFVFFYNEMTHDMFEIRI